MTRTAPQALASALLGLAFSLSLPFTISACSGSQQAELPPKVADPLKVKDKNKTGPIEPIVPAGPVLPWANQTYSPQPGAAPDPFLEQAESGCGRGDAALHDVAQFIAELHQKEGEAPNLDVAKFHLSRHGAPYVMPRLWSASMTGISEEKVAESIRAWAQTRPALGEFRCGLGIARADDGSMVVSALQVDVLAEVKPVPTQVESGKWVDFEAQLLAPTSAATVLLLPPEGRPRHLNTKLKGNRAQARFSIETEGTWLIQLMATQAGGPRPVAQMLVTADDDPPQSLDSHPVPGEDSYDGSKKPTDALFELMNAAREDQGLPLLERNRRLDRAAGDHSRAMIEKGRISHDTGAGNPAYRIELAGLTPKATGENVALAGSVVRLHRVLWASPAHRENLLLRRWDEAGVAIVDDGEGSLYATQLFIDSD
jgi:uncharacterized protein YkwD